MGGLDFRRRLGRESGAVNMLGSPAVFVEESHHSLDWTKS